MSLKIVAMGCLHGELRKTILDFVKSENPDAILISGDFSGGDFADKLRVYERKLVESFGPIPEFWPLKVQIESEKNFRRWAKMSAQNTTKIFQELRKIKVPIFYIHGNWDSVAMEMKGFTVESSGNFFIDEAAGGNLHFIHNKIVRIKDFNIIGFGGYRGTSTKEYLYRDVPAPRLDLRYILQIRSEMKRQMEKLFMRVRDKKRTVLLTHDPPYRVFDYLAPAKKNYGEKVTREVVQKYSPLLCLCSHFHEHQGIAKIRETTVVNSGYGREGQVALIEIDDKMKVKLLKL